MAVGWTCPPGAPIMYPSSRSQPPRPKPRSCTTLPLSSTRSWAFTCKPPQVAPEGAPESGGLTVEPPSAWAPSAWSPASAPDAASGFVEPQSPTSPPPRLPAPPASAMQAVVACVGEDPHPQTATASALRTTVDRESRGMHHLICAQC